MQVFITEHTAALACAAFTKEIVGDGLLALLLGHGSTLTLAERRGELDDAGSLAA